MEGNLERAFSEEPRPGAERKLTGKEEALLVATACAKPPAVRKRWTLTLLADTMVKLTDHDSLSARPCAAGWPRTISSHAQDMWCIPHVDGEYVARMEDVLDLYAETPYPAWPLVCFDETPVQLIGEARCRSRRNRDSASATITSIAATAPSLAILLGVAIRTA